MEAVKPVLEHEDVYFEPPQKRLGTPFLQPSTLDPTSKKKSSCSRRRMIAVLVTVAVLLIMIQAVVAIGGAIGVKIHNRLNAPSNTTRSHQQEISCPELPAPQSGRVVLSSQQRGLGTTATYSCDPSYVAVGDVIRTCQNAGGSTTGLTWSAEEPQCQAKIKSCVIKRSSQNAASVPLFGRSTLPGCTANDNCVNSVHIISVYEARSDHSGGYHPTGYASVNITADRNKDDTRPIILVLASYEPIAWSLILQQGVAIDRVILSSYYISTSSVSGVPSSSVEKLDRYHLGYANGYNADTVKQLEFVADRYGPVSSWTGTYKADEWRLHINRISTNCFPAQSGSLVCERLSLPDNGWIALRPQPNSHNLGLGSVATYVCNSGYALVGQSRRTCVRDSNGGTIGIWNGTSPTCQEIYCPELPALQNGRVVLSSQQRGLDTTATYSCDPSYVVVGDIIRTCQDAGGSTTELTWSAEEPKCQEPGAVPCSRDSTCLEVRSDARCSDGYCRCPGVSIVNERNCLVNFGSCKIEDSAFAQNSAVAASFRGTNQRTRSCRASDNCVNSVHVISVNEAGGDFFSRYRYGNVPVTINITVDNNQDDTRPIVLVLISYEAIGWSINASEGLTIHRVLLSSGHIESSSLRGVPESSVERIRGTYVDGYSTDTVEQLQYITSRYGPVSSWTATNSADSWRLHIERNGTRHCSTTTAPTGTLTCARLTPPKNGRITLTPGPDSLSRGLGSVATYSCNSGYNLIGESNRTCTDPNNGTFSSGIWTGTPPSCQDPSAITCYDDFSCGSSTQRYGEARCIAGYCRCLNVPNVNDETCLAHLGSCKVRGNDASPAATPSFRGASQTSRVKSCQANDNCAHSVHVISVYEAINRGFRQHPIGSATIRITADRNENDTRPITLVLASYEPIAWSLILQQGVAIDRVILSSYYTSSVSGVPASSVKMLDRYHLGYADGYDADTVKQLEFVADRYGPVSSWTGTYRADRWRLHINRNGIDCSYTEATVTCPNLSPPDNGGITLTPDPDSLRLGSVATYSCDSGYALDGQSVRTCVMDTDGGNTGVWSGTPPTCKASTYGPVPISTDPSAITCYNDFSCGSSTQRYGEARCIAGYCRCPNVPNVNEETCLAHVGSCEVKENGVSAAARPSFRGASQLTSGVKSCQANHNCAYSVHVISVYEARSDHFGASYHPTGSSTIRITADRNEDDTRPIVLVLASYEPIAWSLILQQGVTIDRVILSSYYISTSSVSGVPVSSVEKLDRYRLGYANGYDADTVKQLEFVADRYGPASSWTGTYRADRWRLHINRNGTTCG